MRNTKQNQYDLEERTLKFTQRILKYAKRLPKSITNIEIIKQMIRAGGSVGANYIEANEAIGKKDFLMRVKISKKEAKEVRYWLILSEPNEKEGEKEKDLLIKEATELMKIFGSILERSK